MDFKDIKNKRYAYLDTAIKKDGWLILGPGGGGRTLIPTVSPHDTETVLLSCDMTAGYITRNGGDTWREFNLKSRIYSFAFEPVCPDTMYAGACGLYRSVDGGLLWEMLFPNPAAVIGEQRVGDEANYSITSKDNWPGGMVEAVYVDPHQPDHIYIGVNNGSLSIFFSDNDGSSWEKLFEVQGQSIHQLYINPNSPINNKRLFVFTDMGIYSVSVYDKKVRHIGVPIRTAFITHASCGYNPKNKKLLFYIITATASLQQNDVKLSNCVWKSDDEGETWFECRIGLEQPVFSRIAASGQNAHIVYLVVEKLPHFHIETGKWIDRHGVLKSSDEGENWEWVVDMNDFVDPTNRDKGWAEQNYGVQFGDLYGDEQVSPKGRFVWGIGVGASNPEVCYTTDFSSVYKTKDGGRLWNQVCTVEHPDGSVSSRGIDVTGPYGLIFDPFNSAHIVLPYTDGGMFHSLNSGRTWIHTISGVPRELINSCYSMVFDPEVEGKAWSTWAPVHDIPRRKEFSEELYLTYKGGVCNSNDGGFTWGVSGSGLIGNAVPTHIVLDPLSPVGGRTLYIAAFYGGVYKSTDDGYTWRLKNNGIIEEKPFAWKITLLPDGTLFLIVTRSYKGGKWVDGSLYKSMDGAQTWNKMVLPEGVGGPNDLIYDPSDPKRMYLSCWPKVIEGESRYGGLLATIDGGYSWEWLFTPSAHVYSAAIDPENPSTIYLATFDAGIFRSDDKGGNWSRLKGCNFQWYYRPIPDPVHKGMLYLTTFGSSVWYGPATGVEEALEDIGTRGLRGRRGCPESGKKRNAKIIHR